MAEVEAFCRLLAGIIRRMIVEQAIDKKAA